MDNITKLELKVKNSITMKKSSITLSIADAQKLLTEIVELKTQIEALQPAQDDTIYIELDGGNF